MPKGCEFTKKTKLFARAAMLAAMVLAAPAVFADGRRECQMEEIDVPRHDFRFPWMPTGSWGGPELYEIPPGPVAGLIAPWQYASPHGSDAPYYYENETFYFARPGDSVSLSIPLATSGDKDQGIPWSVQYIVDASFSVADGGFKADLRAGLRDSQGLDLAESNSFTYARSNRSTASVVLKAANAQDARHLDIRLTGIDGNRIMPRTVSVRKVTCSQSVLDFDFD